MTLMHSSGLSGSKLPHNNTQHREQDPHYGHYNCLMAIASVRGSYLTLNAAEGRIASKMQSGITFA